MQTPPFRPALLPSRILGQAGPMPPIGIGKPAAAPAPAPAADMPAADAQPAAAGAGRQRLGSLDAQLHCSVIGTCLSTAELRKAMRRFIEVDGASDLDVHHEAVRLTAADPEVAHTLHKLLDRRHDAAVQRFARVRDAAGLAALWKQCLASGEVPGAYWAVLTHRRITPALRQQVFGDLHMLSHLVGAANRADLRRFVAFEQENAELRERSERQQERLDALIAERDDAVAEIRGLRARVAEFERAAGDAAAGKASSPEAERRTAEALSAAVTRQTQRREAAESRARTFEAESTRLAKELEHLREQTDALGRELAAAEAELRRLAGLDEGPATAPGDALTGRRLLYVGGRPSTQPAIRGAVLRGGGLYQHHDGGVEDRKGLLESALAWADVVVFPVDCVDHDSALHLKRACLRQGTPFLALRSASVTSFVAAVAAMTELPGGRSPPGGRCLYHG